MTQFYQITLEKAIADYKLGKLTTFGLVDYYIKIKFAPGWKISIDPRKAIKELGITIHQFRRAIAKIRETVSISLKTTTQLVGEIPEEKSVTANVNRVMRGVNKVTNGVNYVTPSANSDPQTTNKNNASSDSPDIRSNIDQISLSAIDENFEQKKLKANSQELNAISKEERENFLIFANQKVDELPKRPTLPKKWIAANFDDLYSEWKKSSAPVVQDKTLDSQFDEWYMMMYELGNVFDKKKEEGVQLVKDLMGEWVAYEAFARIWKFDNLKRTFDAR